MKNVLITLGTGACLLFGTAACTTSQINQTLDGVLGGSTGEQGVSANEVALGLKEALAIGADKGAQQASQEDGYWGNPKLRIPFPPDVQRVEQRLRQLGLGSEVDRFVLTLNRGAERAAAEAKPVFINAIKAMTIQDAWNILRGEQDAATQYLIRTTSPELKSRFQPIMSSALQEVNATRYYGDLVNTYNRIPGVQRVDPNLESYATDRAIEGLFLLIAEEERNIRENPVARTTELLRRVFSRQ
ncbi:DUF4197 domain-containing protein [Cesiribacter andamanensis]|uniref:DUF4197 domain-containing protein n=1 Tax=Cesiribacter andamanensis AMV16 TaxID=1279009 RepID=M7NT20_9BACT|nr:DUF4197 domain-containing protein [Cesiribacter andamanensis]EMR04820.1 hypothetical protein ADICEAN_00091 [Cesiribacter andamanensis AMV16]